MSDTAYSNDAYRVIVVDDDPDLAHLTSEILRRRVGCEVLTLTDPLLARAAAVDFHPDVIVTDIEMPGLTGLELLVELREDRPGLPAIVMTGHESAEYAVGALRIKANEFLTKPVRSAKLADAVIRLAKQWRVAMSAEANSDRATRVQLALQPVSIDLPGYDLAGGTTPAGLVGGDFYDWRGTESGVDLIVADVMGKGIGAAIIAATVRAVLRAHSRGDDLAKAITDGAAEVYPDLRSTGAFVTLLQARLNAETGGLSYVDAGHGLSIIVRASGGVERLTATNYPLGIARDSDWRAHETSLQPGDTLVVVSDGVLDLWDGSLASLDQVETIVRTSGSAKDIVDVILDKARDDAPDDVTAVALRRNSA